MATILKQEQIANEGMPRMVAFNMDDVQERAATYLAQVKAQCQQLLESATAEADAIRQAARDQGLAEARQAFAAEVEQRAQQLTDDRTRTATNACQQAVSNLESETVKWLQEWRNRTVNLAIAMAEKLVRQSMSSGVEPLRVWLEEALMMMRDAREVQVLVHPDDFTWAGRYLQSMTRHLPLAGQAEVLPDPQVSRGGCIVRCPQGHIDQQLETQLQRLGEQLH
jgi:flagellar assembly protein FliH